MKKGLFILIVTLLTVLSYSCNQQSAQIESEEMNTALQEENKGVIKGKAFYSNSSDSSTIKIVLDKTDGLLTDPVLDALNSDRAAATSRYSYRTVVAYQNCNSDGSYEFSDLEEGIYTVYAASVDSKEKAVYQSVTVTYDESSEVPDLILTATGSLSGKITLDNSKDNNTGFVVFAAGTSYMAVTGFDGSFTISGLPAGIDYQILVMKGSYIYLWKTGVQAVGLKDSKIGEINFESSQITIPVQNGNDGKDGTPIIWKGAYESSAANGLKNHQLLWAYYNTTDGCSYIYDGKNWTLLASAGKESSNEIVTKDVINYVLNGGSLPEEAPRYHSLGKTTALVEPVKTGYRFMGFYLNEDYSDEPITALGNDYVIGQKIYAKWIYEPAYEIINKTESGTITINGNVIKSDIEELVSACLKLNSLKPEIEISLDFTETVNVTTYFSMDFKDCDNIVEITVSNAFLPKFRYLFGNCKNLKKVIICEDVTSIGDEAFAGCSSLSSITIPSTVTAIGREAFSECTGISEITIPSSITSIDVGAFAGCSSLSSITIPSGVTSISNSTFLECTSLSRIAIPSSVTSIGSGAFQGCSSLSSITIPSGVTSIGSGAFERCSSLSSIIIPYGITSIENYSFSECSSLSSITIPSTVTSIGNSAFFECTSLSDITLPDNVTNIGCDAFFGCKELSDIKIPESITEIYSRTFEGTSIESIVIPDTVTKIGDRAFKNCTSLTNVIISDNITEIGSSAFQNCISLSYFKSTSSADNNNADIMVFPQSLEILRCGAFANCVSLGSRIVFFTNMRIIEPCVFAGYVLEYGKTYTLRLYGYWKRTYFQVFQSEEYDDQYYYNTYSASPDSTIYNMKGYEGANTQNFNLIVLEENYLWECN